MTQPREAGHQVDPVTASVIHGALEGIAVEMGYKLMRMSYSSIIRESEDFGAALVDAKGRGLAESAQSTPLQSGPIPGYVRGVLAQCGALPDYLRPPLRCGTLLLDASTLLLRGRPFHALEHAERWRRMEGWRASRLSAFRDLLRFYESLAVFGWYEQRDAAIGR